MGLTVPNSSEATYAAQAMPDARDWDTIVAALGGYGVVSGCAVSAHSPANMTVDVAAGTVKIAGTDYAVSEQLSNTIGAASASNPRIDLITVNTSGTVVVVAGTAAAIPLIPAIPASRAVLAAVYVQANASSMVAANITDKRVLLATAGDHGALSGLADDDHPQYRLESEDHTHATSGAQGGQVSHANLTNLTSGDPHTQYLKEKASGGLPIEIPEHDHTSADEGGTISGSGDVTYAVLQAMQIVNEVMNFPSIEQANGAQPEWWDEADANATLTEIALSGEGITEQYERAHKCVVATANSYYKQRYTYADQPRVKSGRKLSAIFAVWSVGSVAARIRLQSSVGSLGVSGDTTAAAWTILKVEGVDLDGTYVEIRCEVDTGTAYFVPLGICIGEKALPLPPRPLKYCWQDAAVSVKSFAGLGDEATWTDIDVTANTSNLAAKLHCTCRMLGVTSNDWMLSIRRNGSSEANGVPNAVVRSVDGVQYNHASFSVILDAGQIFEYYLDRLSGASTVAAGNIYARAWEEWG